MDPKANESTKNNTPVSTDKLIPTQQSIMATEETSHTHVTSINVWSMTLVISVNSSDKKNAFKSGKHPF